MKFSLYHPHNGRDLLFLPFIEWEASLERTTEDCEFVYSASVSSLERALHDAGNKPVVCWCWDIPFNWRDWSEKPNRDEKNAKYVEMLKKCALVISASKYTQDVLKGAGVQSEQIYSYVDVYGMNKVMALAQQDQVIQISRFAPNKRFEMTIKACPCKLILAGTGLTSEYGKYVFDVAKHAGKKIDFLHMQPRDVVIRALKESKVLCSPSAFEGWGITPIEAVHCGVLPLISELPGHYESFGEAPIYVSTVKELRDKITYFMADTQARQEIISALRPKISRFTPERFAQEWTSIIETKLL